MKRQSIKYGLISGGVMVILILIPFFIFRSMELKTVFKASEIIGYSVMILSLLFIFFGIRSYRDNELGGAISFGRAFMTGLFITFIASLIFAIFNVILYKYIAPNLINEMIDFHKQTLMESPMPKAEMDARLAEFDANRAFYNNVYLQGFIMFSTVFFMGAVITLISSLILKRKLKTQTA